MVKLEDPTSTENRNGHSPKNALDGNTETYFALEGNSADGYWQSYFTVPGIKVAQVAVTSSIDHEDEASEAKVYVGE